MNKINEYFFGLANELNEDYHEFLRIIPSCKQFSYNEISMIYKALDKAIILHDGQFRKNGKPYIIHPIAVASILAEYGFDYETVCAALLHDTIEDTSYTLEECAYDFGNTIATIVDGVTKIGKGVNDITHKKILKSIEIDSRSLAVKCSDRLHNMYTLNNLSLKKQKEISLETKDFYVPISKILGIYKLKDEFQDLCLYYLDNDEFLKYYYLRKYLKDKYGNLLNELSYDVADELFKRGIPIKYKSRVKNVGGIYEEVQNGLLVDNIDDLLAIKIILKNEDDCYLVLELLKKECKINSRIYDYIKCPKTNGYKSINTNVLYKDSDIQVRIRTEKMQGKNNLGIFSDWNNNTKDRINKDMIKSLNELVK